MHAMHESTARDHPEVQLTPESTLSSDNEQFRHWLTFVIRAQGDFEEKDENETDFGFVNNRPFIENEPREKLHTIHNMSTMFMRDWQWTSILLHKIDDKTLSIYAFIVVIHWWFYSDIYFITVTWL